MHGAARDSGLFVFYARATKTVLRRPSVAAPLLLGWLMHGLGHAAIALAAAACARSLLSGALSSGAAGAASAFWLSLLGLAAISAKVCGGAWAAHAQAKVAGDLGGGLRLRVLDGWLGAVSRGQARHFDHGPDRLPSDAASEASTSTRALAALTSDVREVELGLTAGLLGSVRAAAQLAPLLALLAWLAPNLSLYAVLALSVFGWGLGRARRALKRAHALSARQADALLEAADDAVRHADLWATYGAGGVVRAQIQQLNAAFTQRASRLELWGAGVSGASEWLAGLALVLVLGLVRAGVIATPDASIVPFAVAFFMAYRPLRELGDARLAFARADASFSRLRPWLREPATESDVAPRAVAWPVGPLVVDALTLAHGSLAPVTLTLAPGEIVVVRGPTGVGKTTLLRTLLGLEAEVGGSVHYAGNSIAGAPAGPRTRPFAWVPQDAPLLRATLAQNVALGDPDAIPADALAAIGASRLEHDLGTSRLVTERALSGGERQWISLARALATRQPVLLLDEPTSGLDPDSQRMVLSAIARLRGRRSVLLITHRSEPSEIADRVVVLG